MDVRAPELDEKLRVGDAVEGGLDVERRQGDAGAGVDRVDDDGE